MASNRCTIKYEPKTGDIDVEFFFAQSVDAGCYKCRAENIFGHDNTESTLILLNNPNIDERPQTLNPDVFQIIDSPLLNPLAPEVKSDLKKKGKPPKFIIHLPKKIEVSYGEKFNTKCKLEGYPYPKV
jgi:hypothetical protein